MPYMLDGRRLRVGRPFKTATASYSQLWVTALSDEEKKSIGITWEDDPAPFDSTYYFSAGNPRPLDDGTDSDGVKFSGVRPGIVQEQKNTAASLLSPTDWYVTRKSEKDTAIPSNVTTFRDAVRTACAAREIEIAAVKTTEALEALIKAPDKVLDKDGKLVDNSAAHLTPWPELAE